MPVSDCRIIQINIFDKERTNCCGTASAVEKKIDNQLYNFSGSSNQDIVSF